MQLSGPRILKLLNPNLAIIPLIPSEIRPMHRSSEKTIEVVLFAVVIRSSLQNLCIHTQRIYHDSLTRDSKTGKARSFWTLAIQVSWHWGCRIL